MRSKLSIMGTMLLFIALFAVACTSSSEPSELANPASENCVEQGGTVDIRKDADGGEVGYCQFDDGSECDEWDFFRGECAPGDE